MDQLYFESLCKQQNIPITLGCKIIDGRYKPYLSSVDDLYYQGNSVWDAKTNALNAAIKSIGKLELIKRLSCVG